MANKKEEKVLRITRARAATDAILAIKGKSTLTELAEAADQLFVEHGGESKLQAARHQVQRALETLEQAGIVALTRPTDIMVEKVK